MTRANLNFTYRDKGQLKVLYHYHNGDQYPQGIRDYYHLLDWLKEENSFTPEGFTKWLAKNYTQAVIKIYKNPNGTSIEAYDHNKVSAKPKKQGFTIIGDLTDYTYVFNQGIYGRENTIQVYNQEDQIFNGNVEKFIKWLENIKN